MFALVVLDLVVYFFFFFKQKTAYEMRISDWSSDVCSSDLVDEQREAQIAGLVGIYENMRPADAAAIFDGLDIEVLINVLDRMREQKSAAILAGMNPERARQVTTELAQRQKPPAQIGRAHV